MTDESDLALIYKERCHKRRSYVRLQKTIGGIKKCYVRLKNTKAQLGIKYYFGPTFSGINIRQTSKKIKEIKVMKKKKVRRCGRCVSCLLPNCRKCVFCEDMLKFGGPGSLKQACKQRMCVEKLNH